jgi:hypothetical protein
VAASGAGGVAASAMVLLHSACGMHGGESIPPGGEVSLKRLGGSVKSV